MTKTRKKILIAAAIVLFVAGMGFLLFPAVSNFIGQQRADSLIGDYNNTLDNVISDDDDLADTLGITSKSHDEAVANGEIDSEGYPIDSNGNRIYNSPVIFKIDLDKLYEDSKAYNASLINHQGTVDTIDYSSAALRMSDYGLSNVYGYLSAPTIGMNLPIYLGANDYMMSCGAAHLNNTSLPLDEKNTNCAIAGHTGYIGRTFFDNIRNLKKGDVVSIKNYWETIDYEVIDYKSVEPDDTNDIYIRNDRQLLTLITCTSMGYNKFGRYVVICEKK